MKRDRWEAIPAELRKKFAPICPEFVIELRSETDNLRICKIRCKSILIMGRNLVG
ncbi:hypothetical protein [Nostoc sp. FACHB-133]|uniref:hypothetical protein n=1 Tax=Nostoc sp. FACHB-133 TaxID=2692835 RepID=UPI0028C3F5C0|nr:hypothetical protein [Nostoc sp. FACHB-133]